MQMPRTLTFETFLASKIRTSFRSSKIARGGDEVFGQPLVRPRNAQAIAVHLARNYVALTGGLREEMSSLPGFKLRRISEWMTAVAILLKTVD